MAKKISGSVGKGGNNSPADVKTIKQLINRHLGTLPGVGKLPENEVVDPNLIKAIVSFQKNTVGMSRPDGRIDAGKGTWLVLSASKISPVTLTVTHGGKIPTKTKFKTKTKATAGGMYESTFTLTGGLTGKFRGSIYPDDMTVKGRVVDGTYPLHIGFHLGGGKPKKKAADLKVLVSGVRPGLLVNARKSLKVKSDDPRKNTSNGINVHNGRTAKRGSHGCLTIHPNDWSKFITLFLKAFPAISDWHTIGNNTGKKVGTLVIKIK